jgi:release factor glutamine methyltransferase
MNAAPPAAGTVREALEAATDALRAAGVDTPRLDAEVLLGHVLGADRAALLGHGDEGVAPADARALGNAVRRRVRREPVAYITGSKGFRRIELAVDRRVLIPRPETELLVEVALELQPATVLDVGTGSGAIALAIADELPDVTVVGIDSSEGALEVARANAKRLGYEARVTFRIGDGATYSRLPGTSRPDLVVANLPYVADADWASLQPEIRDHEPREALTAGPDGLDAIRALLDGLPDCPSLALEVGIGQAAEVERLVRAAGFSEAFRRTDLAGIERVVVGRR